MIVVVVEYEDLRAHLERVSWGYDPDEAAEEMAARSSLVVDSGSTITG